MKIITINPTKCTGCRMCELACSLKNEGEFIPIKARVQVIGFDEMFSLPLMCFQCEKPYCMPACPEDAISKNDDTGLVEINPKKCVGCRLCSIACPFGNMNFSPQRKIAVKCELCDGNPECTTFCPTEALMYVEVDAAMLKKKKALADRIRDINDNVELPE